MKNIRIEGMEEATRKLKQLEDSLAREAVQKGLEGGASYVRQDAHDKCSVKGGTSVDGFYTSDAEPTPQSGAVRRSIKYEVKTGHAEVFTNHPIAKDLEFGTSRESPHPFMRRSADDGETRRTVGDRFKSAILDAVKRVT